MDLFNMTGKVALVTGASSGLGAHFAETLANAGADVVLAARRVDRIEELASKLSDLGSRVLPVSMDVTDQQSCENALSKAEAEFGTIGVVINNAGLAPSGSFLDTTDEDWDLIMDTNLKGVRRLGQLTARSMVKAEVPGSIINIASVLGLRTFPNESAYCASKAAVIHLTRSMATELFQYGIRVNAICPGWFYTEINDFFFDSEDGQKYMQRIPPKRLGRLDELDGPLLMLASDASTYVNGAILPVDGGHIARLV